MPSNGRPNVHTVITLTLPAPEAELQTGTLLVQRGDLAHLHQFSYTRIADLSDIIADALVVYSAVEADPPVIAEVPSPKPKPASKAHKTEPPAEPTVDIPLKKGSKAVPISRLKIVSGETDAAAYRQAVLLAGRLIDGRLWDGETPIRFDDVYALAKKMKFLTERDLSLFTLDDFVRAGEIAENVQTELPASPVHSSNGHHAP